MSTNLDKLARDPDAVRRDLAERAARLDSTLTSSELVYSPAGRHSYYRDLLALDGKVASPGAEGRISRHREQVRNINAEQRKRAEQRLRAGDIEVRFEPGLTDGQGGYFSPPAWLNRLFATANRPRRVLSDLIPTFPLPAGVSQVNVPIISTGSAVAPTSSGSAVPSQDITDSAGSSTVAALSGAVDVSLQLIEQSPPTAALDWAIGLDLGEGDRR
jgi:hypothetical protein